MTSAANGPPAATVPAGIAQAVVRWVAEEPDAAAVIDGAAVLSRGDLLRWSEDAATTLQRRVGDDGAGGPLLCALLLPRSWAVPFGLIAARFAGLAFLLVDSHDPPARIRAILAVARPCLILTVSSAATTIKWSEGEEIAAPHASLEPLVVIPRDGRRRLPPGAGHVVFTSGSSGEPKGVILRDEPLLRTAAEQRALLGTDGSGVDARAPSLWALSPAFDASLSDIFCAILGHAPLLIFHGSQARWRSLAAAIAHHGVARSDLAPSLLRLVPPEALGLKAVMFGGERCEADAARRWGRATLALQAYGPTEAAVCAMIARAGSDWTSGLLGRPLAHQIVLLASATGVFQVVPEHAGAATDDPAAFNATVLARFQHGPLPPIGRVEGEIWLAGDAIAIGYLDAPETEAAKFGMLNGLRVHRTGDSACWRDGSLLWIGRLDRQIKVHGRRIAPEEIEAIAAEAWGATCLCLPWRGGLALALEAGERTTTPEAVIAAVIARMGTGLRPRATVVLHDWPRLPSGKTDAVAIAAALMRRLDRSA